ncbi:hypothetical protein OsJ_28485 [Oryza sativa Japonica Group]|uniref:Uncharacterized protein n=1 Tax=Oryza sativa subsp. japonica TaxID=39947 RepID=B9G293_ORYSJ|nr:hypothetical protein OsJ_28485 [Oryza sativa Japonica Group]
MGHVLRIPSHGEMQPAWYQCAQGRRTTASATAISSVHTEHTVPATPAVARTTGGCDTTACLPPRAHGHRGRVLDGEGLLVHVIDDERVPPEDRREEVPRCDPVAVVVHVQEFPLKDPKN